MSVIDIADAVGCHKLEVERAIANEFWRSLVGIACVGVLLVAMAVTIIFIYRAHRTVEQLQRSLSISDSPTPTPRPAENK